MQSVVRRSKISNCELIKNRTALSSKTETTGVTIFDKLYLLFFLILPLIYVNKLVDPVLIPRQLYLSLFTFLAGALIYYKIQRQHLHPDFSFLRLPVCIFFFFLLGAILISFLQANVLSESMFLLSKITMEALFFFMTCYLLIQQQLTLKGLLKSVVAFCVISLLIAMYQLFEISVTSNDFFKDVLQVKATYGHKNLLASVLFLTIAFLANALPLSKKWSVTAAIAIFLILIICWLIQTKAVILAFFIFFLLLFLSFLKQRKTIGEKFFVRATLLAVVLFVLAVVVTFQNKQKFSRIFDKNSTFERLSVWDNSMKMASDHFIFGVGAGNWQVHFPKYGLDKFATKDVKNGTTTFQRPHNDFLWVLCEMGIVGLVIYIGLFVCILYYLVKLLQKTEDKKTYWLYTTFFASLAGYLIIAFVDFPLERIEHQLLIGVLFSIITAHYYKNFKKESITKTTVTGIPVFIVVLVVPILFSSVVCFKRWVGEYHSQRLYGFENRNNFNQMIKEADKAMTVFYTMDPMSAPIEWYKGVALFSLGNIAAAQESFERAYQLHPYNIHVMNNLASCYEKLEKHKDAERLYLQALVISSEFEEARLNLSAVYYNEKEYEKAFETIDKCDVNSQDPKYQLFLPSILMSWQEALLKKQQLPITYKLLPQNKLKEIYFESKNQRLIFREHLARCVQYKF